MKILHLLASCTFAAILWTPGGSAAAEPPAPADTVDWPAFMERHDLLWTVLPPDWPQAAFLGNGLLGTSVFGDADGGLRWDVGRRDVMDARNRVAIGRFAMPPAGPPEAFRMRLDLWNAEVRGTWEGPEGTLRWSTVTHAGDPVTVIELSGPAAVRDLPIRFVQEPAVNAGTLFKKFEGMGMRYTRWSTVKDPKVLGEIAKLAAAENPPSETGKTRGVHWCRQPFKRGGGYTVAWGERTDTNGKRLFAFTVDFDEHKPAGTDKAVRDVEAALAAPRGEWIARHRDWWHAYYRQSFLSIPDTRMESFYWIQMYKLAAATRAARPAIDLMGPWTYRTPWPRIWWNLNIQLTYWPVYASNRLNIGESLVRMIDAGRENLIANVPDPEWRKDSAGIGRTSTRDCSSRVGKEPGNLTFALHNYWLHCRYEGDDARLRDGLFPILKRSVAYYLHLLKEGPDGKLHTPHGISPEYPDEASDTNYDLSLLRWGLKTLLAIDKRLALHDPQAPAWRDTLARLAPFPVDPATGYMIGKDVPFTKGHRHFSHLFMVYPLHLVDPTDPAEQALIQRSVENWLDSGRGGLQGYSYTGGAAMRAWMGQGDEAARLMNIFLDRYLKPNTMYMEAGPVIETPLAGASTVHEMLLQSWSVDPFGTDIRVFPAVPAAWKEVAIDHLRAEGAFLVSAVRTAGRTRWVQIESLAGNPCRVRTGIDGPLRAYGDRRFKLSTEKVPGGEVTVVDLKKGESVLLVSANDPPTPADLRIRAVKPAGPPNTYGLHGEAAERAGLRVGLAVRPGKDGVHHLKAPYALLKGGPKLEYNAKEPNIGFWTDPKGTAAWNLDIRTPGRYEVAVRAASRAAHNIVAITAAGQTLKWTNRNTGGWDKFEESTAGILEFPKAGTHRLTMRSADGKGPMINLQKLILRPVAGKAGKPYQPNWESMKTHKAAPEWLQDAKLGIYFHWGVYSVPAYGSEWYPFRMHRPGDGTYKHHLKTYGHPSKFGYHDFVPMFKAEHFDPEEWAGLFASAGARFAGPVAEHHDGFSMWDSDITPWNAADRGPKRDVLGEIFKALRKRDMKTIATFHHARNLQRYPKTKEPKNINDLKKPGDHRVRNNSHYANFEGMPPASDDPELRLLYGNLPENQWVDQVWLGKLKEVVDKYQPDIIWFDSWLDKIPEQKREEFCAYYLNAAEKWSKDVAIVRKQNDLPISFTINDHEKSREPKALPEVWMTDDTISKGSWCYTKGLKIKPASQIVHSLIDTVSKNGIMLLNISPRADGVIPDDQRAVLKALGDWLRINGEAIYETRPWTVAAEGPTAEPEGGFSSAREFQKLKYSAKDIRYTRSKDGKTVYAMIMGWPGAGETAVLGAFAKTAANPSVASVRMLGCEETIKWSLKADGLHVTMPPKAPASSAVCLAIQPK